ncbi:hypothetical protein AGOR_G00110750 [Albula goreensis]|uniref:Cytochrome c oxidase subunit 7A2, mitochondrial n=1 Tax=Albula goreensis TaxID=1534307 RepID=A0A8T3DNL2_9TELE|nr:hypothetical protein AGOR_G00110750 [Albula goreensis]
MFRNLLALRQLGARSISSTARRQVVNKVPEKQRMFQEDNGLPVHLKGGSMDSLLYRLTMVLTVFGTGYIVYELMGAALPKKN